MAPSGAVRSHSGPWQVTRELVRLPCNHPDHLIHDPNTIMDAHEMLAAGSPQPIPQCDAATRSAVRSLVDLTVAPMVPGSRHALDHDAPPGASHLQHAQHSARSRTVANALATSIAPGAASRSGDSEGPGTQDSRGTASARPSRTTLPSALSRPSASGAHASSDSMRRRSSAYSSSRRRWLARLFVQTSV